MKTTLLHFYSLPHHVPPDCKSHTFMGPLAASLKAAFTSSANVFFSVWMTRSTTDTLGVGTRRAIPFNLPFSCRQQGREGVSGRGCIFRSADEKLDRATTSGMKGLYSVLPVAAQEPQPWQHRWRWAQCSRQQHGHGANPGGRRPADAGHQCRSGWWSWFP